MTDETRIQDDDHCPQCGAGLIWGAGPACPEGCALEDEGEGETQEGWPDVSAPRGAWQARYIGADVWTTGATLRWAVDQACAVAEAGRAARGAQLFTPEGMPTAPNAWGQWPPCVSVDVQHAPGAVADFTGDTWTCVGYDGQGRPLYERERG